MLCCKLPNASFLPAMIYCCILFALMNPHSHKTCSSPFALPSQPSIIFTLFLYRNALVSCKFLDIVDCACCCYSMIFGFFDEFCFSKFPFNSPTLYNLILPLSFLVLLCHPERPCIPCLKYHELCIAWV